MVDDQIEYDPHSSIVDSLDKLLGLLESAVLLMDILVILDIIAHVDLGTLVMRAYPDDVDPQVPEIVQFRDDTRDIADSVAIGVFEACRIDLVDDCFLPPFPVVRLMEGFDHDDRA